ncbi:helicase-associated protein [Arthrobacter sp. Soil736]|uniref:helicase-associated protein n=1 Tax=Arthrobacter sp. Soil736 TaxID=1736395 RepID=UPI0012F876C2|nr:helicase-associated protein [Arthrobacter sp. Soil736]
MRSDPQVTKAVMVAGPDGRMDAVATTRRDAAPNPEWVLMYRGGLSRSKIAALAGAPASTVGYHLRVACAADPLLRKAHEAAAGTGASRVTAQGRERMHQLVAMVQETGRYPSRNAESTSERTLAVWLQRRREDTRAGTLAPAFREGLAVLPGWEGKPRRGRRAEVARTARCPRRLPRGRPRLARHKAVVTGEEHELGVWLHSQRFKQRRGELDALKTDALDNAVPGWRAGRQRGRRPLGRA